MSKRKRLNLQAIIALFRRTSLIHSHFFDFSVQFFKKLRKYGDVAWIDSWIYPHLRFDPCDVGIGKSETATHVDQLLFLNE